MAICLIVYPAARDHQKRVNMHYYIAVMNKIGYPNGKILNSEEFVFNSYDEAKSFQKEHHVETPYFTINCAIYTYIEGHKVLLL